MDGMSSGAVSARLALGVTTVALVALASAGTAVVVSTGRSGVNLGSLPPQLSLPLGVSRSGAIVVGAPPGRAWPSDVHPVQRSVTAGPITVGPFQQALSSPAIRGVVSTSFTDGPQPFPAPFVSTAPAAPGPVDNPPSQTPVGNPILGPPVDSLQSQRSPTPPVAPATDVTGPPATGGRPAPAPGPPAPPGPAAGGNPVAPPVVAGPPGRLSIRRAQPPSPIAERATVQASVVVKHAATQPSRSTNGHGQGQAQARNDRHPGQAGGRHPGNDTGKGRGDNTIPRSDSRGDQHGRGDRHGHGGRGDQQGRDQQGRDQQGRGDDQVGHGHGNRPA